MFRDSERADRFLELFERYVVSQETIAQIGKSSWEIVREQVDMLKKIQEDETKDVFIDQAGKGTRWPYDEDPKAQ